MHYLEWLKEHQRRAQLLQDAYDKAVATGMPEQQLLFMRQLREAQTLELWPYGIKKESDEK